MQNHFTIIIDSCNHEQWIERCLDTCLTQRYDNYEVVLVDAVSDDKTYEIAKKYAENFKSLRIYQNEIRLPQVANFLWLAELSKPNTICVSVDSDDWLKHGKVLNKLNDVYNSGDVWMTYGSYLEYSGDDMSLKDVSWHYNAYPDDIIKNNSFREYKWVASHLRTFRRELLLKINKEDLKRSDGKWLDTTGDQAIIFPMLEMSGGKSRHISEPLLVYNVANQQRDGATNEPRQLELSNYIRAKKRYDLIQSLD